MGDLKQCPFCGGKDIGWSWVNTYSIDSSYATFGCMNCGVSFTADEDNTMHPDDVAVWNARATPPEVVSLVEALRPFAKSGEIFPGNPGDLPFDQCIYNPAAGQEYSLCGDDLRRAREALAKWEAAQK